MLTKGVWWPPIEHTTSTQTNSFVCHQLISLINLCFAVVSMKSKPPTVCASAQVEKSFIAVLTNAFECLTFKSLAEIATFAPQNVRNVFVSLENDLDKLYYLLSTATDGISASQSGIISCIAINPALPSVYAAASYMKTIGILLFKK